MIWKFCQALTFLIPEILQSDALYPLLAFPDALLWAKMADAVILTSFAGRTTARDLEDAKEKIYQVNVKLLGTILSNVRSDAGYYRYGYYGYSTYGEGKAPKKPSQNGRRFVVSGYSHETGEEIKRTYIAKDEEEATLKANKDGIIVDIKNVFRIN